MAIKIDEPYLLDYVDSPPDLSGKEILPGLVRETVGLVAAATKVGKSKLLMQTAASVALGLDVFDLWGDETTTLAQGPVVYINLEDPIDFYRVSQSNLARTLKEFLTERDLRTINENFRTLSVTGSSFQIACFDRSSRRVRTTDGWEEIREKLRHIKPVLIIIDTWHRGFTSLDEKDETMGGATVQILESVAHEMNCAILVATHISKFSEREGDLSPASVRGSSAIANAARFFVGMRMMTEEEARKAGVTNPQAWVYRGQTYSNYGPSVPARWFKRSETGVLERRELPKSAAKKSAKSGGALPRKG